MQGIEFFKSEGYDSDLGGILEWPVAWGDCDMFQYVFLSIHPAQSRHIGATSYTDAA
jgi:hypothetical protein